MSRLFFIVLKLLLALLLLGMMLWGVGLIYFRLPGALGAIAAAGFALAGLAGLVGLWTQEARLPLGFAVLFLSLLGWWSGMKPSHQRDWIPELAHLPTISREGDVLTVSNLRNFRWRSDEDYDPRWETRRYDLSQIEGIDIVLSHWTGEAIAHLLVSFSFADQPPLTFSVEIRREKGEEYSALAGFFRSYEMITVAADERDVIGVRTHARHEDARLYRLAATPAQARELLLAYAADIDKLALKPRWYNTLTTNCTTMVFKLVRRLAPHWAFSVPLDPRVVLSGYLPGYLQQIGALRQDIPLAELTRLARISDRARTLSPDDPDFSAKIREGVPGGRP